MDDCLSVGMSGAVDQVLRDHLLRADGQEDICFALFNLASGKDRSSALLSEVVLPQADDRQVHGNVSFNPQYLERALNLASERACGLALLHSHPNGHGWQRLSLPDTSAEKGTAPSAFGATGLPLVGLTLAGDGVWSARFWQRVGPRIYECDWCTSVRVAGEAFRIDFNSEFLPAPKPSPKQVRTVSAWGAEAQADMARLRIGIVGAGSVGGIIAEAVARMGVQRVVTVDPDIIETHNLDRLTYATTDDVGAKKVERLKSYLGRVATADCFENIAVPFCLSERPALMEILDCDLVFSCVDRPWARHLLNQIAYAHLIPVVDGGIAVRTTRSGKLAAADWRSHVCGPPRACLCCLGQYTLEAVQADREGLLEDPVYISGLPDGHPYKARENVFPFAVNCAGRQLLQMIAHVISPGGGNSMTPEHYHFVGDCWEPEGQATCDDGCLFQDLTALGNKHAIR